MRPIILLLVSTVLFLNTSAQNVTRGPYLQSVTHESIIIKWRTDISTSSKVWFGTDSTAITQTEEINNNVTDHQVQLNGLSTKTKYYYKVGDLNGPYSSFYVDHNFTTHPVPGTPDSVRIWAIGDFGRANSGQVAVKNSFMNYTGSRGVDVWMWLGDNAYSDGSDGEYQSKVFNVNGFSDIFSYVPFWPSPGNHDYNTVWSESTTLGIPYSNIPLSDHEGPYFDVVEVPQFAESGGYPSQLEVFYSYDFGDVHFLSLNSEVFDYSFSYDGINQMKDWIEDDLQQNTRKFTIAYFHQPPYSKGSHDSDDAFELVMKAMREKVIPLLEDYDVDLVVNGHSHVFERSYLIKGHYGNSSSFSPSTMMMSNTNGNFSQGNAYIKDGSNTTPEGTVYVVCGNSGSDEGGPDLNYPAMVYADGGNGSYGSFVVDVYRNRLDGKYLKSDGTIGDEFTILKQDLELLSINDGIICEGDSIAVTVPFNGGSDQLSFDWGVSGLTQETEYLKPSTTTQYTVEVTDNLTAQTAQVAFTITVKPTPNPVITEVLAGTLHSGVSGNYNYQWLINGNPISGANAEYFSPTVDGNYAVEVTSQEGCTGTSEEYTFSTVGITTAQAEDKIKIYPNPVNEQLYLKIPSQNAVRAYNIYNAKGQLQLQGTATGDITAVDVTGLAAGNYMIVIGDTQLTFSKQ